MKRKNRATIVLLSGILLAVSFIFNFANLTLLKNAALITATIIAGYPIVVKAWQALRMKAFSIELLVTIAVIGALFIGEYVESGAVTFLFLFGAYLEARSLEKTRSSLKSLMDMAPLEATVIRGGKTVVIPADEVEVGDRVLIQSGEKIAIDGTVIIGQAFVNEAAITGESVPARKQIDDTVFSGTIIDNGYIEVMAEKVGEDTTFSKIIELVEEAQESKAKTQKFLEKFASFYTPAILLLSVIVYIFTKDIELTLTFLVIACPGALVISAPVSIVAGIGNGAVKGILIKGGDVMEKLAKIDVFVFDKTGTLTKGQPEVTAIQTYGMNEITFLTMVAEAEIISEHHLGQTIVKEAHKRGLPLVYKPTHFEVVKGNGIGATVNHNHLLIGNRKWMTANQVNIDKEIQGYATDQEKKGYTAIIVAVNKTIAGVISIADQIRPEAKESIQSLKQSGIKQIYMLTGDNKHAAEKVANQLGIDGVFAELLPEDKVNKIKELKNNGFNVAMVGDGINDAPAIATADIGFAMGGTGTDVAMETADVVIMADKLEKLSEAHRLAKATIRNMKQNMFFAVATVIFLLVGVLLKQVFLASGMLVHELSVLIVIMNALRLVYFRKTNKKNRSSLNGTLLPSSR
ncbi:copper/silver-translocating P-type ATPase [Schinkia azotoformans MEV2011]|uniref:Cd(2+)-exporting ATPase n=1 Tax=Schinkia azotoformans MEV2011 TaxID=1348973 RepID=A0A072NLG4_SCHAZ|nr:cation-translocating P-type ATPase [Schinkia azotoformans]KEF37758.1 copper/silver-translocating P-type ATPase [Schinkia azotoformans MEV2011]MEC1695623.1 cation-translocating P-type ATPase [Schinkia azotoformans]MEC1717659.1 cation-translocating P-type ATPase [Schinkia azotoformans]MEC1726558.1 cation-translocating P-type ATPase [Schinkia azotoformans]MEC1742020.1 cation-translocating P-type ATPase [Schinkia azotoformans]